MDSVAAAVVAAVAVVVAAAVVVVVATVASVPSLALALGVRGWGTGQVPHHPSPTTVTRTCRIHCVWCGCVCVRVRVQLVVVGPMRVGLLSGWGLSSAVAWATLFFLCMPW